jgi:hypothetical protein
VVQPHPVAPAERSGVGLRFGRVLRYAWAAPATALGLVLGGMALLVGARARRVHGVLEISGGAVRTFVEAWPWRFVAITFGHVVLGVDAATLEQSRAHERVHVRQYERWGPLFLPLYLGSSLVQWLRGRDAYRDNCFEREAFARDGRDSARTSA